MPLSRMAATICSLSARLTRGSLAPCAISTGILICSTRDSGERDHRNSGSVSGFPTRVWNRPSTIGFQYGGRDSIKVIKLDGPTPEMAQRNRSGVKVAPTRAA